MTQPTLLCDADGCLFPSEDPAYDASATVTARFLDQMGIEESWSADELRREFTGLNFRATATELCRRHDVHVPADVLDHWVEVERDVVTRHLAQVLRPDPSVQDSLRVLAPAVQLAVVSSSAAPRIGECLEATGLAALFPVRHRFSAEDLEPPASKPAPDVYLGAMRSLGVPPERALAVEDSVVGVRAAVAAGVPVVGLVRFVAAEETPERRAGLLEAGAAAVVESWDEVADMAASHLGVMRHPLDAS
jgi:beta-phosphoglucomutase-like phosphatase (HAD superfamily)